MQFIVTSVTKTVDQSHTKVPVRYKAVYNMRAMCQDRSMSVRFYPAVLTILSLRGKRRRAEPGRAASRPGYTPSPLGSAATTGWRWDDCTERFRDTTAMTWCLCANSTKSNILLKGKKHILSYISLSRTRNASNVKGVISLDLFVYFKLLRQTKK